MTFELFRERFDAIASVPPELQEYERWLESQRQAKTERDYLFAEPAVRFEPRKDDVVRALEGLQVQQKGKRVLLRSVEPPATLELPGIPLRPAQRMLEAIDGRRCLLEVRWQAGVDGATLARFLRATFGRVVFAPQAVEALEARLTGAELVRFPGPPYTIERAYWDNMAAVRDWFEKQPEALDDGSPFLRLLRELHVLALMGPTLQSFYKPASPISDRVVAPGVLYSGEPRLRAGESTTIFLDGPRVNAKLLGGEGYHRALGRSLDEPEALAHECSFESDGLSWGRWVTARSEKDEQPGPWFLPPRPMRDGHFEVLRRELRAAASAAAAKDRDALLVGVARAHQGFVRLHPFHCANQSVIMNLVNALLTRGLGAGIPHLILDHLALRLSPEAYVRVFARAVASFGVTDRTPSSRLATLMDRQQRAEALIKELSACSNDADAEQLVAQQPDAARWALVRG